MSHSMMMRLSRPALIGAFLVATATSALAVSAPVKTPQANGASLEADDTRVPAGEVLVLHGHGFPHDAHVALRAGRAGGQTKRIGGAHTGRRGSFVAEVRIDPDAPAGRYVALACRDHCRIKATVQFRIQRP